MMRALIVVALLTGALGVVVAATHPAVSSGAQVKPPNEPPNNGSLFAKIGL